jgi:hypothetical protein
LRRLAGSLRGAEQKQGFVMVARGGKSVFRVAAGILSLGLLTLILSAPASAQGIIERIFGSLRPAVEAPQMPTAIHAFADPSTTLDNAINSSPRATTGPAHAFCVRTCDGRFFPVQARAGLSAAESCHAFCPASQTRLYSGSTIDTSVAHDGRRYADLDNAFVYRKQLVNGCTCNGRDAFGLAHVDVKSDPTLRPGDVVATKAGLMAFTGAKNNVADFTPIDAYRGISESARSKLSEMKIMPPNLGAPNATPVSLPLTDHARTDSHRSAQLER